MTFDFCTVHRKHFATCVFLPTLAVISLTAAMPALAETDTQPNVALDLVWENHYITEGRNNLDKGGIAWAVASVEHNDMVAYAVVGRADQVNYTEWNAGLEYTLHLDYDIEATLGYQRLEFYGDERASDNEFFSSITYNGLDWLVPVVNYTYATEASGYFVTLSVYSPWEINSQLTLTPYVSQGFDFGYSSEAHDGTNHVQFGLEAEYQFSENLMFATHISHSIALEDIKQQAAADGQQGSLDETYAGIAVSWGF
ncbi:hypothetical protein [Shewanella saliphila]|uniref:Outer membrane protein n=1 Tax=Shewanella saliphila TaxID=2282698 RepID=A0ABQ2Q4U1_9GAMM|nr:hypothetical protein [Shewanella saliphila]MCL1101208.1 hypothetical protein [Shewanella saliphila]GGP48107.1 hypothetical protein GCM10009409_13460 [Shewanella saliphila]